MVQHALSGEVEILQKEYSLGRVPGMLRNALIVVILMLLALGVADARLPQVGDQVKIMTS
jgi:hypothetical protein